MTNQILLALTLLTTTSCLAQTPDAVARVTQLTDYWRWKHYWDGTNELGTQYEPGRRFETLLFWNSNEMRPSVGFCSADLGICQYYPDTAMISECYEMKLSSGQKAQAAYQQFLAKSFGQKRPLSASSEVRAGDYTSEMITITLPPLDPPDAIRNHESPPQSEVDALVASLTGLPDLPRAKVHLLAPFYSHRDPWVPVFRQCSGCPNSKPMIIYMRFVEGHGWWHGVMDFNDNPDEVKRMRRQIEKALLVEVKR